MLLLLLLLQLGRFHSRTRSQQLNTLTLPLGYLGASGELAHPCRKSGHHTPCGGVLEEGVVRGALSRARYQGRLVLVGGKLRVGRTLELTIGRDSTRAVVVEMSTWADGT